MEIISVMKKVLIITTHFAPDIHVGAKRMTKVAKHLAEYAWQPIILTKEIGEYHGVDETLLQGLPYDLPIYRIPEWHLFRRGARHAMVTSGVSSAQDGKRASSLPSGLIRILDFFLFYDYFWLLPAFFTARGLIHREGIQVIYSSSPSHEANLVALLLRLTMPVKWVCEFRDPWSTLHPYYPQIYMLQRNCDKHLESLVLQYSDQVVTVGQMLKEELIRLAGSLCQDKVRVIYNGYDKDDFIAKVSRVPKDDRCVITYTGTWVPGRSPEHFLEALALFLKRSPGVRGHLTVNFVGEFKYCPDLENKIRHYIEQANLSSVVSLIPWLPYREALARLLHSDILLLVERPESSTNNNFWVVTSKIFLYLYARRPILALLPSGGEAAKIIRETNAGEIVSPTDLEGIASKISEMHGRFRRGELLSRVKVSEIDKYERRTQTGELTKIFDDLVADTTRGKRREGAAALRKSH